MIFCSVRIRAQLLHDAHTVIEAPTQPGQHSTGGWLVLWLTQGPDSVPYLVRRPIQPTAIDHMTASRLCRQLRRGAVVTVHAARLQIRHDHSAHVIHVIDTDLIEITP